MVLSRLTAEQVWEGQFMRMQSGEAWDARYRAGKYDYLRAAGERVRLGEIARLIGAEIAARGPVEVADIGCGEGLLLEALKGTGVSLYVAVDPSAVALSRIPRSDIPVEKKRMALGEWDGSPAALAPRIFVASEVLYYAPDGVSALQALVRSCAKPAGVIVSIVAGEAGKPNWETASRRLWRELGAAGWGEASRLRVAQSGHAWDIALFRA